MERSGWGEERWISTRTSPRASGGVLLGAQGLTRADNQHQARHLPPATHLLKNVGDGDRAGHTPRASLQLLHPQLFIPKRVSCSPGYRARMSGRSGARPAPRYPGATPDPHHGDAPPTPRGRERPPARPYLVIGDVGPRVGRRDGRGGGGRERCPEPGRAAAEPGDASGRPQHAALRRGGQGRGPAPPPRSSSRPAPPPAPSAPPARPG